LKKGIDVDCEGIGSSERSLAIKEVGTLVVRNGDGETGPDFYLSGLEAMNYHLSDFRICSSDSEVGRIGRKRTARPIALSLIE
jgi:hypothetical protein